MAQKDFSDKDISKFKKLLESKKDQVVKEISTFLKLKSSNDTFRTKGDFADIAQAEKDGDVRRERLRKNQKLLREIEHAIEKIQNGEYGSCEGTGMPINKKRLKARPWSRYSVEYKEQLEKQNR